MASSKEYLAFILEQLSEMDGITYRSMMGEYIIYHHGKIAAYLCDDRLLVKNISCAAKMMSDAVEAYHLGFIDIDTEQTMNGIRYVPMKFEK